MRMMAVLAALMLAISGATCAGAQPPGGGPGDWQVGPMKDGTCRARLNGPDVDLVEMINKDGKLVLAAGHGGWDKWGQFESQLAIDGGTPASISSSIR